jgi:transaldolase
MNATHRLHEAGQSLWLDNITRGILTSGTLRRYIDEFSIAGLTSNPTIFDHAVRNGTDYDGEIRQRLVDGESSEALFFGLALTDLRQAADLFRPIHERTNGLDGWVSLEVSPLLAHDTAGTIASVKRLHAEAGRPNLFTKIPGTPEGVPAIEEAIFAGVPINVTLLFSRAQYVAAAEAYLRGIERRISAGLNPNVGSVASLFISRWDVAVRANAPAALRAPLDAALAHNPFPDRPLATEAGLRDQLGIAVAGQTYETYRFLVDSPRWQRIFNAGARRQRLLWASTGTKDPEASDILYIHALAAPFTVNTMPEATLKALADHGEIDQTLPARARCCDEVLARYAGAGIDLDALAAQLQDDGAKSFDRSWNELLASIACKGETLKKAS